MRSISRARRFAPLLLVSAAITFNLIALRDEVRFAQPVNDAGLHLEMIRWANVQIDAGRIPLDGWFPNLQLGSPQFHHYQSTPHILSAYASRMFGVERTYNWSLYVLLSLWPLCVYAAARLFGWSTSISAAAAAAAPLLHSVPGYGFEYESYTWSGLGLWSQLWAMWTLPIAWALSWRAISGRGPVVLAALATAATAAFHLIAGYLAFTLLPVWALAARAGRLRDRALRAAGVAAGSALIASWVLVPLVADARWQARSSFNQGTAFGDSFGAGRVLGWLFSGGLFDRGHIPVVTVLVLVGFLRCVRRRRTDERARALLFAWVACMLLFFGRPTLGPLLRLMPGIGDVILHRMVMGVHMTSLFMAGLGAVAAGRFVARVVAAPARRLRLAVPVATAIVAIAVTVPAWSERWSAARDGSQLIRAQQAADAGPDVADAVALIDRARAEGGGRIFAGLRSAWGKDYRAGFVPVYSLLASRRADAVGFTFRTAALSVDVEAYFDESNPAHYDLMNVRYLLRPQERAPAVPATLIARRGHHTLWRVQTGGYLRVIETAPPAIEADRATIVPAMLAFLRSDSLARGVHPPVAFGNGDPAAPTRERASLLPPDRAGRVENQISFPDEGAYGGRATLSRPGVVMLSASFDGRWTATVDGRQAPIQFVAPSFVGVAVGAGTHSILFEYEPFAAYPWLFALGIATALWLWLGPWLVARRRLSAASPSASGAAAASPSSWPRRWGRGRQARG